MQDLENIETKGELDGCRVRMIHVMNLVRPLELNPEPSVVASTLVGKVGNTTDDIASNTTHRNLKMLACMRIQKLVIVSYII